MIVIILMTLLGCISLQFIFHTHTSYLITNVIELARAVYDSNHFNDTRPYTRCARSTTSSRHLHYTLAFDAMHLVVACAICLFPLLRVELMIALRAHLK